MCESDICINAIKDIIDAANFKSTKYNSLYAIMCKVVLINISRL